MCAGLVLARGLAPTTMPVAAIVARWSMGQNNTASIRPAARHYLARARAVAGSLTVQHGPPKGLTALVAVLDNQAMVWTIPAARAALQRAGADILEHPLALHRFAQWCGLQPSWRLLPGRGDPQVVAHDSSVLATASKEARRALRWTGVIEGQRLVDHVHRSTGVQLHGTPADLAQLIGLDGDDRHLWLAHADAVHLDTVLRQIGNAYDSVTLEDLAAALTRTRAGVGALARCWPPTADALAAWLPSRPGWSVAVTNGHRVVSTARSNSWLVARDVKLMAALRRGVVGRSMVIQALANAGFTPSTAAVHVSRSPLLLSNSRGCRVLAQE